ncbi:MAG TPA: hypothetical protein VGF60_10340 [Xanthobacteraceae bacterium]
MLRSFNTWAFKREQPADPHLLAQSVSAAISRNEPVSFVLYWGKGPRCALAEPERQCLDFLASMAKRVQGAYPPGAALTLICTDSHARLNGHSEDCIDTYFAELEVVARRFGFRCCRLGELTAALDAAAASVIESPSEETLERLLPSARRWYRGSGTVEEGALRYYRMNMIERRAVERAFPRSIFVTFNGSELRSLFPQSLPVFYMYSMRRGVGSKPWFVPASTTLCGMPACQCRAFQD